jgi:hypothetical protein
MARPWRDGSLDELRLDIVITLIDVDENRNHSVVQDDVGRCHKGYRGDNNLVAIRPSMKLFQRLQGELQRAGA